MKIELFTLCDGAFNTNGRLTIVNTFDNIKTGHFPLKYAMGIALKVFMPKVECKDYEIRLSIIAPDDSLVHEIKAPVQIAKNNEDIHIAMAINIQGVVFNSAGKYHVDIAFDEKVLLSFPFKVE